MTTSTLLQPVAEVIASATEAVRALGAGGWQVPACELGERVAGLAAVVDAAQAAMVALTAEAESRSEVTGSARTWVARQAGWSASRATPVAKAAEVATRPDLPEVADAVLTGRVTPAMGVLAARELDKLTSALPVHVHETVQREFVRLATTEEPRTIRRLHESLLDRYATPEMWAEREAAAAAAVELSAAVSCGDFYHYELTLDAEGHAVLEAAIGPSSAPRPGPDGERDPRPAGLRRGQALVAGLRRIVDGRASGLPGGKATLLVALDHEALLAQLGRAGADGSGAPRRRSSPSSAGTGEACGSLADGVRLGPTAIRKLACDAAIVPSVLGSDGAVLDHGRAVRLFTPAQSRALVQRDRGCTFPGCDAPGFWCDAHHLVHWCDGGRTDLDNAALLCEPHHTMVHQQRYAGRVVGGAVEWTTVTGSYDAAPAASGDPPDTG